MFTLEQRVELKSISALLFGSSSKWQKLLKDPNYQIITNVNTLPNAQQYVRLKTGTYRKDKAVKLGLIKEGDAKKVPLVTKVESRLPTFDEFKKSLQSILDSKLMTVLPIEDRCQLMAWRCVRGYNIYPTAYPIGLVREKDEQYNNNMASLLKTLGEDDRELVEGLIDDNTEQQKLFFDANTFIGDFIFARSHGEVSDQESEKIMFAAMKLFTEANKKERKKEGIASIFGITDETKYPGRGGKAKKNHQKTTTKATAKRRRKVEKINKAKGRSKK